MNVLLGILIAIVVIIVAVIAFFGLLNVLSRSQDDELTDLFHGAFDGIFWLQGYLKESEPDKYRKVHAQLDKAIDALLDAERILQIDEENEN